MTRVYYLNGKISSLEKSGISIYDRGLLYGDGIFETVKVYNYRPFALEKHIERAIQGAQFLGIAVPGGGDTLFQAAGELIQAEKLAQGSLRISLTRGLTGSGLWPGEECTPTLMVTAQDQVAYKAEAYSRGFRAARVSFPRNEKSPLVRLKTLNFLENILARREAAGRRLDESLFLNREGVLAEGTVSNVFLIRGGEICTPPVEAGILPGITREITLELSRSLTGKVKEVQLHPEELAKAEEAFLTSSLMEIMPLVEFEGKRVGDGKPGSTTQKLHRLYKEFVNEYPGL